MAQGMSGVTLVLGGVRSGKSRFAEGEIARCTAPWVYVATGQAFDQEMRERITEHQSRRDSRWHTVEVPFDVAQALDEAGEQPVLLDCLTLWLTNILLEDRCVDEFVSILLAALRRRVGPTVLVGNEVGLGVVPESALGRRFRDEAGMLHQRIAAEAGRVVFVAAGLPLVLKGKAL
ncbi:bifunctional adenosylcobinamide kinase/adenosylcobinamide-phosphate guanylyltransferase [Neokomagataea sp. TBRC 2177]|uniref:Bifunctional adenosylcobalamin biosynthesis protein n=2 Tax=Neokomagataea anthophila TaxID=2826925 RepID=A0ABS5E922_9PROT|nr:bifunctional adenosylcobinamide kinase/adenosylcobinamide-phosphate guanylyltransferase [Neokomagataea anthophila]